VEQQCVVRILVLLKKKKKKERKKNKKKRKNTARKVTTVYGIQYNKYGARGRSRREQCLGDLTSQPYYEWGDFLQS
jgi:hypothetical protein